MKKYIVLSVLSMLSLVARADVKTYTCTGGVSLNIRYQVASGQSFIGTLLLANTGGWDGTYHALGDGFGFIRGTDTTPLYLSIELFSVEDAGTLTLPSGQVIDCSD